MRLRPLFANELSNLEFAQPVDHQRTHDERRKQCGETGKRSAKRQIAEDTKGRKVALQLHKQQPVEQSASVLRSSQFLPSRRVFQISSAFSNFTPRDAFNSATSPSRASRANHSPASSAADTNSARIPACFAALTMASARPRTPSKTSILLLAMCCPACRCISSPA